MDSSGALRFLASARVDLEGLIPWASNYTFLVRLENGQAVWLGVYKPQAGERPLWDFPQGTLCLRECAAFLVSEALGWRLVPPTVLRDGPYGVGMVQLFIDADPEAHYFTLHGRYLAQLGRMALFDILVNNADRKSGHVLRDRQDHIWAIDHGITFHQKHKLRTVIWNFAGQPIPPALLHDLATLEKQLVDEDALMRSLTPLLSDAEIEALIRRIRRLRGGGYFPEPCAGRHIPWPPV